MLWLVEWLRPMRVIIYLCKTTKSCYTVHKTKYSNMGCLYRLISTACNLKQLYINFLMNELAKTRILITTLEPNRVGALLQIFVRIHMS